jgi:hypothetical protein
LIISIVIDKQVVLIASNSVLSIIALSQKKSFSKDSAAYKSTSKFIT